MGLTGIEWLVAILQGRITGVSIHQPDRGHARDSVQIYSWK